MNSGKKKLKFMVDILMTLTLLFLMGYQIWGETAHEWAGACMLVLFLVHHVLNSAWYKNMFRGKYTRIRILMCAVDLALFVVMICLMASGIIMSRHVFAFLPVSGGMGTARLVRYGGLLLGLCADGISSGAPLGHGAGTVPADVWDGQEFRDSSYRSPDSRCFYCGLRPVCICDKKSGDLHVPEDTVCVSGLQRVPAIFLHRLSGYDRAVYLDRPLSV